MYDASSTHRTDIFTTAAKGSDQYGACAVAAVTLDQDSACRQCFFANGGAERLEEVKIAPVVPMEITFMDTEDKY